MICQRLEMEAHVILRCGGGACTQLSVTAFHKKAPVRQTADGHLLISVESVGSLGLKAISLGLAMSLGLVWLSMRMKLCASWFASTGLLVVIHDCMSRISN